MRWEEKLEKLAVFRRTLRSLVVAKRVFTLAEMQAIARAAAWIGANKPDGDDEDLLRMVADELGGEGEG